jgi:hypothetical protein
MLSGARGWLTVSPKTMSKKHPIDKHVGYYDKQPVQTGLSPLSPEWMHHQSKE